MKKKIIRVLIAVGVVLFLAALWPLVMFFLAQREAVTDVAKTAQYYVDKVVKPTSIEELKNFIIESKKPISVAGGRFSQGGQIAIDRGTIVDMTAFNRIIALDTERKTLTVQSGCRWRTVQQYIDPYNLSVYIMQSYNDFTVGGSLSVNVHARDIHAGSFVHSVESFVIMLADGTLVRASRKENQDLFAGVIGGYGALGIVTEVTLRLTDNYAIERETRKSSLKEYLSFFRESIFDDPKAVFHNGNLDVQNFNTIVAVTWYKTDKNLTINDRLQKKESVYVWNMFAEQMMRRFSFLKRFRTQFDYLSARSPEVVLRNYEMSYTVQALEPILRFPTTTILQEYFVPVDEVENFIEKFAALVKKFNINVINASLRYVPRDTTTLLSYAPRDSFALVLYINILKTLQGIDYERLWTQEIIDVVLERHGSYYLPYQLLAAKSQFYTAYPGVAQLRNLKRLYDPQATFSNRLWEYYCL